MRILLSYYQASSTLTATESACDISTKAFRLFKSINSASKIFQLLSSDSSDLDQPLVILLKGIEETLLVFHYYHENKLFLSSLGLISSPQKGEISRSKVCWFLAELSGLLALLMEYRYHQLTLESLRWRIARLEAAQLNTEQVLSHSLSVSFFLSLSPCPLCLCLS